MKTILSQDDVQTLLCSNDPKELVLKFSKYFNESLKKSDKRELNAIFFETYREILYQIDHNGLAYTPLAQNIVHTFVGLGWEDGATTKNTFWENLSWLKEAQERFSRIGRKIFLDKMFRPGGREHYSLLRKAKDNFHKNISRSYKILVMILCLILRFWPREKKLTYTLSDYEEIIINNLHDLHLAYDTHFSVSESRRRWETGEDYTFYDSLRSFDRMMMEVRFIIGDFIPSGQDNFYLNWENLLNRVKAKNV